MNDIKEHFISQDQNQAGQGFDRGPPIGNPYFAPSRPEFGEGPRGPYLNGHTLPLQGHQNPGQAEYLRRQGEGIGLREKRRYWH
jgi:hypothetical protein